MDENRYNEITPPEHRRALGQYFTPPVLARFMTAWACAGAETMLDPAAGNSVFLRAARERYPGLVLTGYEIDPGILDFFGNPAGAELVNADYLKSGWEDTWDAVVCNPPYHRFQDVPGRDAVLADIRAHTGVRLSGYTNLYLLFLVKSIAQMSERGRLAYLVPSEFLNARYGTPVKRLLLERRLLRAVIDLPNDAGLFDNAVTTCCILLLDREEKVAVDFVSLASEEELDDPCPPRTVAYSDLDPAAKWRGHLRAEETAARRNLRPVSDFCRVSRGIATGANAFFCLRRSELERLGLPERCLAPCVCRAPDVKRPVFTMEDWRALAAADRRAYLLDVGRIDDPALEAYIRRGEADGVDRRYLPSKRTPWYAMEQKPPAPIWVCSVGRGGLKLVRNRAGVKALTTFHGIYVKDGFADDTDLIFAVLLTPAAQELLRENRKMLGNGLEKFQPNDLNAALMPDITIFSDADRAALRRLAADPTPERIAAADRIVRRNIVT